MNTPFASPTLEPHHGSEVSPQQESNDQRSTSSPAPEVMAPAGVSKSWDWIDRGKYRMCIGRGGAVYVASECRFCQGTSEVEVGGGGYVGSAAIDPPCGHYERCGKCDGGQLIIDNGDEDFDAQVSYFLDRLRADERPAFTDLLERLERKSVADAEAA